MSGTEPDAVAEALARLDDEVAAGAVDLVEYWRRRAVIEAGEVAGTGVPGPPRVRAEPSGEHGTLPSGSSGPPVGPGPEDAATTHSIGSAELLPPGPAASERPPSRRLRAVRS